MKREIKFRGKRIDNGEWVYGYYCFIGYSDSQKHYIIPTFASAFYGIEVDPETVGQYTELCDDTEEENELFESDVTEIVYDGDKYICEIKFCAGGFMFVNDSLPDSYIFLHEFTEYDRNYGWVVDSRKLGNRYDHPHLLGGNNEI